ncbi:MAG TPA: PH domain-containing protein [Anaerolineales bacterium]|nr:PH domain-containing protein [Anaerolineales bacterium]HLE73763.1 PH domain-containing protein [Anaerolineales bacterium]
MDSTKTKRFKPHFLFSPFANLFSTRVLKVSTNQVVFITGFFDKDERTVPISKITDVSINQGILGAIFRASNLSIQTSGTDQAEILFKNMGRAREARDLILKYIADAEK